MENPTQQKFVDFIKKCPFFSEEEHERLIDTSQLKRQEFYLNIFHFFESLFPGIDKQAFNDLSFCGYLYFKSLLAFDYFLDDMTASKKANDFVFKQGLIFHEECMKGLAWFFPYESPFWAAFDELKKVYYKGIGLERKLGKGVIEFSEKNFVELATCKSILCNNTINALCHLASEFEYRDILEKSLIDLHVGFTLLDDIDDFKKDFAQKQKTFAISLLEGYLKLHEIDYDPTNTEILYRYFLVSGIPIKCLEMAKQRFESSLKIVAHLPIKAYHAFINAQIEKIDNLIWFIRMLLNKMQSKIEKNSKTFFQSEPDSLNTIHVKNSIDTSLEFLNAQINEAGLWTDFLNNKGFGTFWVSSFVGFQLLSAQIRTKQVERVGEIIYQNFEKSGAYNDASIQDGDSSGFRMGFLKLLGKEITPAFLENWQCFQNPNGSWTTYNAPSKLRENLKSDQNVDVSGWCMAHTCVSAAAALISHFLENNELSYSKTIDFLVEQQKTEGYWDSYWWTSPVYATSFALQALLLNKDKKYKKQIDSGLNWLAANQHANGFWQSRFDTRGNVFYTALALKPLIISRKVAYKPVINKGIQWLIENQMADGSWKTQRILKMPAPHIKNPDTIKKWNSSFYGTNIIVDDHERVFTGSVVMNSLQAYFDICL